MAHSESVNNPQYSVLTESGPTRRRNNTPILNLHESIPLMANDTMPPLASPEPELNVNDSDGEPVTQPYPGIDDGFFDNQPRNETEDVPIDNRPHEIPHITPRAGPEGGSDPDDVDGSTKPVNPDSESEKPNLIPGRHPYAPHWPDVELGSSPDIDSIPDVNVYQHKKTLAQGMMDLALFSANANQLRYVLESNAHPYFYPSLVMISISLLLQVAVGIGLIWNATYNVKDDKQICIANRINNFTVIGIFLVTVINVFISAFGVGNGTVTSTNAT